MADMNLFGEIAPVKNLSGSIYPSSGGAVIITAIEGITVSDDGEGNVTFTIG